MPKELEVGDYIGYSLAVFHRVQELAVQDFVAVVYSCLDFVVQRNGGMAVVAAMELVGASMGSEARNWRQKFVDLYIRIVAAVGIVAVELRALEVHNTKLFNVIPLVQEVFFLLKTASYCIYIPGLCW